MTNFLPTKTILPILVATVFLFSYKLAAATLNVVTEEAISLQYKSTITNKMEGPAADLVEKVINTAGIDFTTKILPWARAYKEAEQTKNTLIYSIVRTPERESKFHWLGVISKPQYYLFALKANKLPQSNKSQDFKEYRIATLLNSASYHQLQEQGFSNLVPLKSGKTVFEMLKKNRVDLITANKLTFEKICKFNSVGCDEVIAVAPINMPENSYLYFAINKESDPVLVNKLKTTYETLTLNNEVAVF